MRNPECALVPACSTQRIVGDDDGRPRCVEMTSNDTVVAPKDSRLPFKWFLESVYIGCLNIAHPPGAVSKLGRAICWTT